MRCSVYFMLLGFAFFRDQSHVRQVLVDTGSNVSMICQIIADELGENDSTRFRFTVDDVPINVRETLNRIKDVRQRRLAVEIVEDGYQDAVNRARHPAIHQIDAILRNQFVASDADQDITETLEAKEIISLLRTLLDGAHGAPRGCSKSSMDEEITEEILTWLKEVRNKPLNQVVECLKDDFFRWMLLELAWCPWWNSGVWCIGCTMHLSAKPRHHLASGISALLVSSRRTEVQLLCDLKSIFSGGLQVPNRWMHESKPSSHLEKLCGGYVVIQCDSPVDHAKKWHALLIVCVCVHFMIYKLPTVDHPKYIGSKHNLSKVVGHPKKHPYIPIVRDWRNELFAAKELLTVACLFSSALLEDAFSCSWMHDWGFCGRGLELNGSVWKIMGDQWRAWVSRYTHIYTFSIHIEILNYVYTNIQL